MNERRITNMLLLIIVLPVLFYVINSYTSFFSVFTAFIFDGGKTWEVVSENKVPKYVS